MSIKTRNPEHVAIVERLSGGRPIFDDFFYALGEGVDGDPIRIYRAVAALESLHGFLRISDYYCCVRTDLSERGVDIPKSQHTIMHPNTKVMQVMRAELMEVGGSLEELDARQLPRNDYNRAFEQIKNVARSRKRAWVRVCDYDLGLDPNGLTPEGDDGFLMLDDVVTVALRPSEDAAPLDLESERPMEPMRRRVPRSRLGLLPHRDSAAKLDIPLHTDEVLQHPPRTSLPPLPATLLRDVNGLLGQIRNDGLSNETTQNLPYSDIDAVASMQRAFSLLRIGRMNDESMMTIIDVPDVLEDLPVLYPKHAQQVVAVVQLLERHWDALCEHAAAAYRNSPAATSL